MSSRRKAGMLFLETENISIRTALEKKLIEEVEELKSGERKGRLPLELTTCDFDSATFHLTAVTADNEPTSVLQLSLKMEALNGYYENGGKDMLDEKYKDYNAEYDSKEQKVTVSIDSEKLPEDTETVIKRLARLKRNMLAAPFDRCFKDLVAGKAGGEAIVLPYRKDEQMFIVPKAGVVIMVILINYKDPTDRALSAVFLQEFAEANRSVNGSPTCNFSELPPKEVTDLKCELKKSDGNVGYLTLAVNKNHIKRDGAQERVTNLIMGVRMYLHYHIKCSKSFLMNRMRDKVKSLMQVLDRAKWKVGSKKTGGRGKRNF